MYRALSAFLRMDQPQITITSMEDDNMTETGTMSCSLEDIDG